MDKEAILMLLVSLVVLLLITTGSIGLALTLKSALCSAR